MKAKTYILTFFFISLFVLICSCGSNNTNAQDTTGTKTKKQLKEEREARLTWERLQAKADTAKRYCRDKNFDTNYCMLVDMSVHSGKNRFFVWDFTKDTIAYSSLCCHGYGKGSSESEPVFSNTPNSYCTSLGKYKTGARSYSNWGINIHYKLHGLEKTNNKAFDRIFVLHSYGYVPRNEICPDDLPLGYSQGCPVIDSGVMTIMDNMLKKTKKPMLLWIYNK